jgi:hypothetical protein
MDHRLRILARGLPDMVNYVMPKLGFSQFFEQKKTSEPWEGIGFAKWKFSKNLKPSSYDVPPIIPCVVKRRCMQTSRHGLKIDSNLEYEDIVLSVANMVTDIVASKYARIYFSTGGYAWDVFRILLAAHGDANCANTFGMLPVELVVLISKLATSHVEDLQYKYQTDAVFGPHYIPRVHNMVFADRKDRKKMIYCMMNVSMVKASEEVLSPNDLIEVTFTLATPSHWDMYLSMVKTECFS